ITGNTFAGTVSYGIAGTEDMSIASISGNVFNTTVEGIGLGNGVSLAGSTLNRARIFTMLDGQTFSLAGGYALKDYRDATVYVNQSTSIQTAINGSENGDTILVGAGTYAEPLMVAKDVTLISHAGAAATTIRGAAPTGETIRFTANGVTLGGAGAGFTIDNGDAADGRAIAPAGTSGAAIIGNTIVNAVRGVQGDFYGRPTNLTITGNTFSSSVSYGIAGTEDMSIASISGNVFNTTVEGIGLGAGVSLAGNALDRARIFTMLDGQTFSLAGGYALKDYRDATVYATAATSIQGALDGATAGDTIWLQAGAYTTGTATAAVNNLTVHVPAGVTGFTGLVLATGVTNGTLAGTGSVSLTGNTAANVLAGNAGNNVLTGLSGDDTLFGGAGNDVLSGGAGSNSLDGGSGSDTAVYAGNYASFTVAFGATVRVTGTDINDALVNVERLQFADRLVTLTVGAPGNDSQTFSRALNEYSISIDGSDLVIDGPDTIDRVNGIELLIFSGGQSVQVVGAAVGSSYVTIAQGVAAASPGDVVLVAPGTYPEVVTLDKPGLLVRSITGAGSTTIAGASADPNGPYTVRFAANGVTLGGVGTGFTVSNLNAPNGRAIAPAGTNGGAIIGNTIVNAVRGVQGDFYGRPTNLAITGNTFAGTVSYGIAGTEDMSIASISGNVFNTTVEGIGLGNG
ncbi:MAG: hypothetical protein KGS47_17070, partial [Chloroflexi bacterium]|nr:hypothetical protein [Chloroflexota bacterium]